MKTYRILSVLITLTLMFIVSGCSSSGSGSDSASTLPTTPTTTTPVVTDEVNLLGTWNYALSTTDPECTGFVANGILDFQSLNGDITTIGDLLIQGEGILIANSICTLATVNLTYTEWSGRPAMLAAAEFLTFKNIDLIGTGQTVRYDVFTSARIVEVTTMPDGVVGTFTWTR